MYLQYPNIVTQKFSVGLSIENRPIYAVKISDNPTINESEPQVHMNSLIHAREPQAMMTIMYYMYYLLENYGTDPEVTYLVNNREIYFIPCINPDGY
jgi:murein tripeptide amidase MpaA